MVICPFAPYGLAHGPNTCQIWHKLGPDLWSAYLWNRWMDLPHLKFHGLVWTCSCAMSSLFDLDLGFSRSNFDHGLPMGQKLVKSGSTWARHCGTHISETPGWIYTIRSSMELSRPVVVQHHGHLTLTLDFQGQILKMLYLRNGRADWHGTKGMWIDTMLDPCCDFQCSPLPWPWP